MATKEEIQRTYDPMDKFFRISLGPFADITNVWPDKNWGEPTLKNLKSAQREKHAQYFKRLKLFPGAWLLDIGCGWGAFMKYCSERGVHVIGLTLSKAQYKHLSSHGFDVRLISWEQFDPGEIKFDAVVAIGSPEHFVSEEAFRQGRQAEIYQHLFCRVASWLTPGGAFAGQMMTWNSEIPTLDEISLSAPKDSRGYHVALLQKLYPGSWLAKDFDSFYYESGGSDLFKIKAVIQGREQYVWTMSAWGRQFRKVLPLKKWWYVGQIFYRALWDRNTRLWLIAILKKSNKLCFINEWMGHQFFFLEKR